MKAAVLSGMLLSLAAGTAAEAQTVLEQIEREVTAIVRQARASVVTIEDTRETASAATSAAQLSAEKGKVPPSSDGPELKRTGEPVRSSQVSKVGSGFVMESGFVVTTADVLEGMSGPSIVTDDGVRYRASVVQIDHELNVGILRLPSVAKIPVLPLGASSAVRSGQFAIAIGNQVGQPNAVAITLVSGWRKEGSFAGRRFYPTLLQVAGSLGGGASGAPLLNSRGDVIGMLVAVSGSGMDPKGSGGYAIPIDELRKTVRLMCNVKMYLRAWLGADLREEARVVQKPDGIVDTVRTVSVEAVHPNSPAATAGLLRGDILRSMNGRPITRMAEVRAAVVQLKPGETLRFGAQRAQQEIEAIVRFSALPQRREPNP